MPSNFYMLFVAALIPLLVGAIYYNPKVVGSAWMKTNNFTEESMKGGNMALIFGLTFLFSFFMAFMLMGMVIHQGGLFQIMLPEIGESGSDAQKLFNDVMGTYGNRFRSWGHGALHGAMVALLFVFPIIAINALFEKRGWKYIMIHTGYWLISLVLMGALLCQTLVWAPLS